MLLPVVGLESLQSSHGNRENQKSLSIEAKTWHPGLLTYSDLTRQPKGRILFAAPQCSGFILQTWIKVSRTDKTPASYLVIFPMFARSMLLDYTVLI